MSPKEAAIAEQRSSALAYFGACATFVSAGPTLIKLNNHLLNQMNFPFPIALSALGVGFSALISRALLGSGLIKFQQPQLASSWNFTLTNALPNAALAAMTLALGNSAYVYLSVSICTMLKALTPAITLGLLYLMRIESPTRTEMGCVVLITVGTIVSTRGSVKLSTLGLALQLGANCAEALRIVLAQRLLANMKLPLLEMQYHVAPLQLVCLLGSSLLVELNEPEKRAVACSALSAHPWLFSAAGVLGLLVQLAGLLTVKIAGSVAVKLLGIARGAALVLFEATFASADARPDATQLASYATSVFSFVLYTHVRLNRTPESAAAAAANGGAQQKAKQKAK